MTIVLFSRIFYDAKDLSEFPLYMTPCLQKVFFCSALDPFHFVIAVLWIHFILTGIQINFFSSMLFFDKTKISESGGCTRFFFQNLIFNLELEIRNVLITSQHLKHQNKQLFLGLKSDLENLDPDPEHCFCIDFMVELKF